MTGLRIAVEMCEVLLDVLVIMVPIIFDFLVIILSRRGISEFFTRVVIQERL
jgi:hypothetical protein